ncbi:efflux transporter outer membrane subunit [Dyella soli]|uniref:Efflux transporter outer membrane subunit n=1 Tax=Dyella soli TaxID=522319 RepID=A0A4R0YMK1_9GAMM|nr:efflux transporter outer membrane subunit [Dyella soli]TCI10107.1 efflux transporter outer membrane subunit [Dyella soli]
MSTSSLRLRAIGVALAVSLLGACDLAPKDARPTLPPVEAYKEIGDWAMAQPGGGLPQDHWWHVFHDASLDKLEEQATQANQDIQVAMARFDEARADARVAQADYYPTVNATGSATRNHLSASVADPARNRTFKQYETGFDLNYEIDLWGRVRNEVRAGKFRADASGDDLAAVELRIQAELAIDYFVLGGYDLEQNILDDTVRNYQKFLDLTQARVQVGYARKADVSTAQAQLEGARTQATEMRLKRANLEHAIAILTGAPPSNLSLPARPLDIEPPPIAVNIPSALLERRPDIAAAEDRVAAANADIGVARAAYFPTLNLTALFGVESAAAGQLFNAPSEAWSFGPTALLNIFDGGRRKAGTAKARAGHAEAVAAYRQTVLNAFGEVEDNLSSLNRLREEAQTQHAAVVAAAESTRHATDLYAGGLQSNFNVVEAQNIELAARLTDADIKTRRMTSSVLLIKALGGGWQRDGQGLGSVDR